MQTGDTLIGSVIDVQAHESRCRFRSPSADIRQICDQAAKSYVSCGSRRGFGRPIAASTPVRWAMFSSPPSDKICRTGRRGRQRHIRVDQARSAFRYWNGAVCCGRESRQWAVLNCPCGCGERANARIKVVARNSWSLTISGGKASHSPSLLTSSMDVTSAIAPPVLASPLEVGCRSSMRGSPGQSALSPDRLHDGAIKRLPLFQLQPRCDSRKCQS